MEHKILSALIADRASFDRIDPHISTNDITPEGSMILKYIRKFYYSDLKAQSVDLDIIQRAVLRGLQNPKHSAIFETYFSNIAAQDVSAVNIVSEVLEAKRESLYMALAEAILSKNTKRREELVEEAVSLGSDLTLEGSVHEEYQDLDAEELLTPLDPAHLIRVAPPSLNRRLKGGVLPGHHIVVVAYPETGKTMACMTMLAGFVAQNLKVLYIGNEDPIKSIVMRFVSCLTSWTDEEIARNPTQAFRTARARGYDRAVFAGLNGGTLAEVRSLVVKHQPQVLVVDQIRNLTSDAENRTLQLEGAARGMRNLAREFQLVAVSVTQGADSARKKLILDMGDVDGSNVGIPGACDVMIMIGMNDDMALNDRRQLTLAKNKVGGDHASWAVSVSPQHSRILDMGV